MAKASTNIEKQLRRKFDISSFAYGKWEYGGPQAQYHPYFEMSVKGTVTFGDRYFVLQYEIDVQTNNQSLKTVNPPPSLNNDHLAEPLTRHQALRLPSIPSPYNDNDSRIFYEVHFPYSAVQSTTLDHGKEQSIVFTMTEAPKIWETQYKQRVRAISLKDPPLRLATSCQVYRLRLSNASDIPHLLNLERACILSQFTLYPVPPFLCDISLEEQYGQLRLAMETINLSFGVQFQLQKLAQNGYLPPLVVLNIVDHVSFIEQDSGTERAVAALRRLFQQLPYSGPLTKAGDLDTRAVHGLLSRNLETVKEEQSGQVSVMVTYRAEVTPTTIYLAGPDPETSNEVLRKYAEHSENFLRVTFMDEDGDGLYSDRFQSNRIIFHTRFKGILRNGIKVGGRLYEFLGFSHSSLKAQTCWFLAPFMEGDTRVDADLIISKLGDFSHIRSPARCAARIGQAFMETSSSIAIGTTIVEEVDDVERNDRVFSDGVGTCSSKVLEMLQQATRRSGDSFTRMATIFQIRFRGAKGVISLDNRLEGHILRLRPSMIKYRRPKESSRDSSIGICGIASKMLPLVLNRQLIKILEDLGVPNNVFEELQHRAIDELRASVSSVANAASFLDMYKVGASTQTTWLLRKMQALGLNLSDDMFFRDLLDAVVLIQLQDLKFKTRIPVKAGATLYGIMDETSSLAEGEVYCSWIDKEGRSEHASGPVIVARSPALHPGDIQIARAVEISKDSPLSALHNCVVFSSMGERDLPSQLAGGDLDGDLYHIAWDPMLIPKSCHRPASYPRVPPLNIERQVTRHDMSDFFVQFMEQDQLGRVANQHKILADQHKQGTLHPDCIQLAQLHSTAVDFSKTGIPIREHELPKICSQFTSRFQPDFMAPGRKVTIENHGILFEPEEIFFTESDDPRKVGEPKRKRYYESQKILGILYRAIDERAFFKDLHERSAVLKDDTKPSRGVLAHLWDYVLAETVGLEWDHYVGHAADMRETYEAAISDIILQYSTHPTEQLEELEVFIGKIISRTGYRSKRQEEFTTGMKEKYNREVLAYMSDMRDDTMVGEEYEALRRSMACLYVGIQEPRELRGRVEGCRKETFGWIAAAACMKELEVYQEQRDVGPLRRALGKIKTGVGYLKR
ncbi:MAG: hypothetical protein Q9224_004705 [Gallowayella concinna]